MVIIVMLLGIAQCLERCVLISFASYRRQHRKKEEFSQGIWNNKERLSWNTAKTPRGNLSSTLVYACSPSWPIEDVKTNLTLALIWDFSICLYSELNSSSRAQQKWSRWISSDGAIGLLKSQTCLSNEIKGYCLLKTRWWNLYPANCNLIKWKS